ncbi:MAG: fumarate hydratase class, partial [Pseudomonadota bacterium]
NGPAVLETPKLEDWPEITYDTSNGKRVNLDSITPEEVASWVAVPEA